MNYFDFERKNNCAEWIEKTSNLIRCEKWSQLTQPPPCCHGYCQICEHEEPLPCRIERMFIKEGKFCNKAQEIALYMNKNKPLDWKVAIAMSQTLSVEKLKDVVEYGLIDVNDSSLPRTFLSRYNVPHWKEAIEYLFEKGCSVDIQDDDGYSLVMNANCWWKRYDHEQTKFLLERGADPFLENKEGYSLVSYAKEYFSKEEQNRLFELIEGIFMV